MSVIVSSRQLLGRGLDGSERVLEIDRDITDRKRGEEELQTRPRRAGREGRAAARRTCQTANRTLLMVSACDQALVQISDERELTGVICQIIQDEGEYPLVWVGLLDDGERTPFAASPPRVTGTGISIGSRGRWRTRPWRPDRRRRAIRTRRTDGEPRHRRRDRGQRVETRPRCHAVFAQWPPFHSSTRARTSSASWSSTPTSVHGFEQKQVTLLKELADDLAFGITSAPRPRGTRPGAEGPGAEGVTAAGARRRDRPYGAEGAAENRPAPPRPDPAAPRRHALRAGGPGGAAAGGRSTGRAREAERARAGMHRRVPLPHVRAQPSLLHRAGPVHGPGLARGRG